MSEPWQNGSAPAAASQLAARFVCRVSGAPSSTVDALRAERSLELLGRLHDLERRLKADREPLSQALFEAIGAAQEKPARNRLISIKRELFNLRPVPPQRVADAAALVDASTAESLRAFAAGLAERAALEDEVRSQVRAETLELRGRFRGLLEDADFRKGLMISSRALYAALPRYAPAAELGGREEKMERGLLRYYTRMAMKATPFSTFCAIIPGTFEDADASAEGDTLRFDGDPRQKRSYVRINKVLYGLLFDHLKERPAVRHALRVELNPTLRLQDGRLVYLTAIDNREVFQRLADNEVLQLIAGMCRGMGRPTLGELIGALVSDPQIEATPEEAEAYLDKIIEIGLLRFATGIGEQDADWDLPFRRLLDAMDDDHARQASELLGELRGLTERYTDAAVGERERMVEQMHARVAAAVESMEIKARTRRDMPFYEDATSAAQARVPLTPPVRRAMDGFTDWVRMTSRVAWPRGEQATMRHFFDDFYGSAKAVPLLVFYEDFYREHFKAHVEKEARQRNGQPPEEGEPKYNVANPFELDFVKRLSVAREALGESIRRRWAEGVDAEEITVTTADVEDALAGVENTSDVCRSMDAFSCLLPPASEEAPARLLIQGSSYTTGFGKYFSRFLYMLPDDMQEQVRRENAGLTDDLLAEICGDAQFNANLHPPLLRWEISYPTGESGAAEQQLRSSDIVVEPDPEDANALRLTHAPTGSRVVPVDLGFLNPRMRPPLYQLLSRFTPPATFSPMVPESPDPRPAPASGEASTEASPAAAASPHDGVHSESQPDGCDEAEGAAREASPEAAVAEAAPAPQPEPKIQVRPRIMFEDTLVLARRRWLVPGALFPQREPHESAADFFLRASRWRAEHDIPETSFVRVLPHATTAQPRPGETPGDGTPAEAQAEEVPGYDAAAEPHAEDEAHEEPAAAAAEGGDGAEGGEGDAAEGEKQPPKKFTPGSRDLFKPQFMDFGNPLLVGLLGKLGANLKGYNVVFEERLPDSGALYRHGDDRYATELVVQLYFPAGTARGAAHAPAGREEHAAVA